MINLNGTPYSLEKNSEIEIEKQIRELENRVLLLRRSGVLTPETIKRYYGEKRFEQVAESNAIEGSTLNAGETELAVLKGITTTGHDPAFIRDAISLDKALQELVVMARDTENPLDNEQLHKIHGLILADRRGSGIFRNEPVRIKGSEHIPPETWNDVMTNMESLQDWSKKNKEIPAPIRAVILHAWLAYIHPFIDGNGRTARAIINLELIKNGYPPIIIKKKEKERYRESLSESDSGGDIRSFFQFILEKINDSLTGLELSAQKMQGYHPAVEKIRLERESYLKIFETSNELLIRTIEYYLNEMLKPVRGHCSIKIFDFPLDIESYMALCDGIPISNSWSFIVNVDISGYERVEKLAYFGYRSQIMSRHLDNIGAPSIYWSSKNPNGYPKWVGDEKNVPYCIEMTTKQGIGDSWIIRKTNGIFENLSTSELGHKIASSFIELVDR
jgi:Fic family protein